jgi:2-(1,2-epoxy-1,2-dihydrophenyl)acetyl-CoA isomerase|tara:strand:- start:42288 stop:43082 length:795 start_codon:yes stop_codon:yes gene_type:complete
VTKEITLDISQGIATVCLARPEALNALTTAGFIELTQTLEALSHDPEVAVVLLTGTGHAFCAGGDVKSMAAGDEFTEPTLEGRAQTLRRAMDCARLLHQMPKPTLAIVRGAVAGAGMSIALSCDLRIASDTTRFITAFKEVAYSGDFGGSYFLTHLVGPAKARELYFLSDKLDAAQALKLGIVNRVVDDALLEEEAERISRKLVRGPSIAYGYMKKNLNLAETASLNEVMDAEAWHHTRCGMTEDHLEGARAFLQKRAPVFRGY